jgi:hypothetical protein
MKQVLMLEELVQEDALPQATFQEEMSLPLHAEANDVSEASCQRDWLLSEKVPQKNTFIHYDLQTDRPQTPSKSAPGTLLRRLFQTKSTDESNGSDMPKSSFSCQSVLSSSTNECTMYETDSDASTTDSPAVCISAPTEPRPDILYLHQIGQCTPCNYFRYKVDGCRQGADCVFCHHCPKGELKRRKKEQIRQLKKQIRADQSLPQTMVMQGQQILC